MINKRVIINIVFIVILSFLAISFTIKTIDIDMFFSIKLGENTITDGFSNIDTLTYHKNLKYINVRYLYNILVYKIYNTYSFDGIYIFAMICNIVNFNLIYFIIYKLTNKNSKIAFIFTGISIFLSHEYLYARTINISLTLFLLEFYSINKILETNHKKYYFIMIILPVLLVNIHGSLFLIFFIFYVPFVAEYLIFKFSKKKDFDSRNYENLFKLGIINFFEGLISPCGIMPYKLPFLIILGKSIISIKELQVGSFYMMLSSIISLGMITVIITEDEKMHNYLFVFMLDVLSLLIKRAFLYFATIQIIVLAIIFSNYINNNKGSFFYKLYRKNLIIYLNMAIYIVIAIIVFNFNYNKDYIDETRYPVKATQFLLENVNLNEKKLFNGFNSGSYLEFNDIKTFMDGRSEIFESNYNNTTILKDYIDACITIKVNYKNFIKKYKFDILLIDKSFKIYEEIKNDEKSNLITIYEDEQFIIYENI